MKKFPAWLALAILALLSGVAAADDCCGHCGCKCNLRAVCRLKCETKKVPKTTYCCECEDFCIAGPSKRCGCITETDECGCEHTKPNWIPQCGTVHTRTKLVKKVTEKEEKVYKWVVEYVCDSCANNCGHCAQCEAAGNSAQQTAYDESGAEESRIGSSLKRLLPSISR